MFRHINCLGLNDSFIQITVSNQSILVAFPELGIGHVKRLHREVIPFSDWCSASKERERKVYVLRSCTHNSVVFGFFSPGRGRCCPHPPTQTSSETHSKGAGAGAVSPLYLDGLELRLPESSSPWLCQ